jgi:hypothetical protein
MMTREPMLRWSVAAAALAAVTGLAACDVGYGMSDEAAAFRKQQQPAPVYHDATSDNGSSGGGSSGGGHSD